MIGSIWDDVQRRFRFGDTVTQLILINIIVWASLIVLGVFARLWGGNMSSISEYLSVPSDTWTLLKRPWTVLTYMFTHEDLFHILFNMLFLFWFGEVVRNYLGNHRIIPIYVYGGLVGFLFYFISANLFGGFFVELQNSRMLGASAGVMAIMWAAVAIAPTHMFNLILIGPVQIRYIALFSLLMDLLAIQNMNNTGGSLAHIGGAVLGFTFIKQLQNGSDWGIGFNKTLDQLKTFFENLNKPKPQRPKQASTTERKGPKMAYKNTERQKANSGSARPQQDTDLNHQERVDAILDKIKEAGYDNLTKEEKEFLFKVSNKNR